MARVKICGINSVAAMEAACEAGADWIGFVFVPQSPRRITPAEAEALNRRVRGGPLRVGLFVDPTTTMIETALDAVPLDVLQIYAPLARAVELRSLFGVAVWHVIAVGTTADLPQAGQPVDGLVLEAPVPAAAVLPGGNGARVNAAVMYGWRAPLPWLLAGGLTPANVAANIAASGAMAVDVSSGVEQVRGEKDAKLIAAFVAAARAAPVQTNLPSISEAHLERD